MKDNNLKMRIHNNERVLGTWSNIPSSALVDAVTNSGIDFIVIDLEHGPICMETAQDMVRAAQSNGVSALVRVPHNDSHLILRALDIGSNGIQVPHVLTKEDAGQVVNSAKYYPLGRRGYSPFTRAGKFSLAAANHAINSNNNTLVVVNVEGVKGIKNLRAISRVKGIDVVFIGPYDLSQSLGKPGKVNDPEVISLIRKSAKIIRGQGCACGSFANDHSYLDLLIDAGVQYITFSVDSALIALTYENICNRFRKIKK